MKFPALRFLLSTATLALVASTSAFAQKNNAGSTGSTGPTVIPGGAVTTKYVISKSGSYILGGDREVTTLDVSGIEVSAPDVTIDLNGFKLAVAAGSNVARGIDVTAPENIEIRNGSVINGFHGIYAFQGKGVRVIDVRVVDSVNGITSKAADTLVSRSHTADCTNGMVIQGEGAVVADCMVSGGIGGIYVGTAGRVLRSTVKGCSTQGVGFGSKGSIVGCSIFGCGLGIYTAFRTTIRDNELVDNTTGISNASSSGTAVLIGNRLSNTTNFTGVYVDGGGNILL